MSANGSFEAEARERLTRMEGIIAALSESAKKITEALELMSRIEERQTSHRHDVDRAFTEQRAMRTENEVKQEKLRTDLEHRLEKVGETFERRLEKANEIGNARYERLKAMIWVISLVLCGAGYGAGALLRIPA